MFRSLILILALCFSFNTFAVFSATKQKTLKMGGAYAIIYEVDFASVTAGTIVTGLNRVIFAHFTNEVTDDHGITNKNSATASVTEDDPGQVHISAVTSSDTGSVLIIGY